MTYTVQHGRRHEIEFYAEPSNMEYLDGIAQVLHGPGATWLTHGGAHRCISISDDKCTYIIEEVDIWQSLLEKNPKQHKGTKIVEINLTCGICKAKYRGWRIVSNDARDGWTGDKHWLYIDHCPACPLMSPDVWLSSLGYYPEQPVLTPTDSSEPAVRPTSASIDMTDFV